MSQAGEMLQTLIRPMVLEDVPRVREIDVASFSLPWPERSYRFEVLENPSSCNFVVEISQNGHKPVIAGMLVMWIILDEAHIGTIAIDKPYRQLGLGRQLLAEALLEALRKGVSVSFLEVRRSNDPAIALYEKFGFLVSGIRARYYKDNNEDALLMTLSPLQRERLEALKQK